MFPLVHGLTASSSSDGELLFYDTFTDSFMEVKDHTPDVGTSWIQDSGVNTFIYDGTYLRTYISGGNRAVTISDAVPASRTLKYRHSSVTASNVIGVVTRHDSINNQVGTTANSSGIIRIDQVIGSTKTTLASVNTGVTVVPSDVFEVTDDGSTITVYKNGVSILSHTTSTFSGSPAAGLWCGSNYGYVEDFALTSGIAVTGTMP